MYFLENKFFPTLSGLLSRAPVQLQLLHDGGCGRDGGRRGQDRDDRGHGGGFLLVVGPEASPDQLKVDRLAGVSENFHCLLIGASLDVYAIHLQGATVGVNPDMKMSEKCLGK